MKTLKKIILALERHSTKIITGVVILLLISGIIYSILIGDSLRYWDEKQYYTLAKNLVRTKTYTLDGSTPTAYRPVGYPAFLSIMIAMGANVVVLRIANFILMGLSVILLSRIVKEVAGRAAGALAALAVFGYAVLFYTAGTLYPQTIATTYLLIILSLLGYKSRPNLSKAIIAGVLFGLLILTVPTFLFVLFVTLVWLAFSYRTASLKPITAILLPTLFLVSLWSVRNWHVFGCFVLISNNSGINLLLGNSAKTTPSSGVNADISQYEEMTEGMSETERDRFFRSKAIEWIMAHKDEAFILYIKKVLHYLHYKDKLATEKEFSRTKEWIMLLIYVPLLLLFIGRLICIRWIRPSKKEVLYIILYIGFAFFTSVFFTRIRFRLPMDYLMIGVVSMFIVSLFTRDKDIDDRIQLKD